MFIHVTPSNTNIKPGGVRPLYRQIADALAADIRAGRYGVGHILPTEVQLAAQRGVSRGSIRQAMQLLSDWGLVERIRKLGTRVISQSAPRGYVQSLSSLNAALGLAGDTIMRIDDIADVRSDSEPSLLNETTATGFWLQLTGARHLVGEQPISTWTRVWVPGQYTGIRPMVRAEIPSIFMLVQQVYGLQVTHLRQTVAAIGLPSYAVDVLKLPEGAPVLEVHAWLYAATGELIEFVRSIHNPAMVKMEFVAYSNGTAATHELAGPIVGGIR